MIRPQNRLFPILIIILIIVIFAVPFRYLSDTRATLFGLIWPVARICAVPFHYLRGSMTSLGQYLDLQQRNETILQQNSQLRSELALLKEAATENRRLKKLLLFKQNTTFDTIPAVVVGRDPDTWFESIIINKGTRDGLVRNMAVVTGDGVVGKVLEIGKAFSKVMLITDPRSRIGGMVQENREAGIVEGSTHNTCLMKYISNRSTILVGNYVISSGLGGVYPKGLVIGQIAKIVQEQPMLYISARIETSVDFGRLEEVLVIISS